MRILLLSGEESGNIYADMIRGRLADCEIRGYADYGFTTGELAVMGFWPVLKRLPFFLKVASRMKRAIDEWRPDAVCTVDDPVVHHSFSSPSRIRTSCTTLSTWRVPGNISTATARVAL